MFNNTTTPALIVFAFGMLMSLGCMALSLASLIIILKDKKRRNSYYRWLDDQMADKRPSEDPKKEKPVKTPQKDNAAYSYKETLIYNNPHRDPSVDKVFRQIGDVLEKSQLGFDAMDGAFAKMDAAFDAVNGVLSKKKGKCK